MVIKHKIDKKISDKIYADKVKIQKVLNCLFSNALKFTKKGGIILGIKLIKSDKAFSQITKKMMTYLKFSVQDTGIGIEKSKMDSLLKSM